MKGPLLAPRDAGRLLGVTTSAVIRLDERGKLSALRDSAGRRLFRREDVERLLRERQGHPRPARRRSNDD